MIRDAYRALQVYRTASAPALIDLADNTNAFGTAPSALAAIAAWAGEDPTRYPAPAATPLREAIAEWLGIEPDQIVCGCGSNDVIDASMRALAEPGARLAFASPTFVMTAHFAATNSLIPVPIPLGRDFEVDADALLDTGAPLIYLASPNNPSATLADPAAIDRLLDRAPGVVILDEAYAEFAGVSRVREAVERGNVLVTRTFSKAWGLAGLRVGYGIGAAPLVTEIEKARGPFKVNAVAERAASAAVLHDRDWLADVVERVRRSRERFLTRLTALDLRPPRSAANFVGVPVPDAAEASRRIEERGVAVRAFRGVPNVGDLLRITIAPDEVMDRVVEGLEAIPR